MTFEEWKYIQRVNLDKPEEVLDKKQKKQRHTGSIDPKDVRYKDCRKKEKEKEKKEPKKHAEEEGFKYFAKAGN